MYCMAVGGPENQEGANSNEVGLIRPMVQIGLDDLSKIWGSMVPPGPFGPLDSDRPVVLHLVMVKVTDVTTNTQ